MRKNLLSLITILLIGLAFLKTVYNEKFWRIDFVIKADAISYYEYLTGAFIEKDLSFKFVDNPQSLNRDKYMYQKLPDDINFNKYTCGIAILHSPFFLAAYCIAPYFDQAQDGYSDIFEIALLLGCIFYTCIGLLFLSKILLHFFSDFITSITLFSITIGTNLFLYTTSEPGMTHPYSFCMVSIFLWLVICWFDKATLKLSLLIGIVGGLIILLRPTNATIWLLLPLYGITNFKTFQLRIALLLKHFKYALLMFVGGFIIFIPQLLYWKYSVGHWIFYSYGKEGFFFSHPHIIDGLFSYRNGLFVYTPLMLFAIFGMFLLRKRAKEFALFIPLFFILNTWIILSWWCWWYSGFGNRAFIDSYPLMAIAMGAAFSAIANQSKVRSVILVVVVSSFAYINWYQQWQYKYGIMHWAAMTKQSYWAIFLKDQKPEGFDKLLKEPDNEKALKYGRESD